MGVVIEHEALPGHDPVTLGAGSDPALGLSGQELTLILPASGRAFTVVNALPTTGSEGDAVYLTTDKHPYVYQT